MWVVTHIPYKPVVPETRDGARLALVKGEWAGLGVQRSWCGASVSQTAAQGISKH